MKYIYIVGFAVCSMISTYAHASQLIHIGQYSLAGTIANGAKDRPGFIVETTPENTYAGLALDEPVNITHITVGIDISAWPVLSRGRLDHIQMVMDGKNAALYKSLYGRHVVVDCSIGFVGRFYTPVFCGVNKITLSPEGSTTQERASQTAPLFKPLSSNYSNTMALFEKLSYCVVPTAQYGQYSSYDGGKSSGSILMDKCTNEFIAWNKSCLDDGGTKDSCLTEALVYAQAILKKFNK